MTSKKILKTLSKNYWTVSTVILAVLLIAVLISGGLTGATVSAETAGQKVLEFANKQGANADLISVNDEGALFEIVLSIDEQEIPVYVTKDGINLVPSLIPLEDTTTPSANTPSTPAPTPEVVKSDKPVVEAFIMSHCPYGTQIEKGLIPVMSLLGDKVDAEIKFVYYAMHGEPEVTEQLNQYCIQKENKELYLNYLTCFLEAGDGEGCIASTGVDTTALATCVEATDEEFDVIANLEDESSWMSGRFPQFNIHKAENDAYGIGGSPTLVINGATFVSNAQNCGSATTCVVYPVGRDSQSILNAICAAFNEAPEECNTDLSSLGNPAPGFGFGTQGGATAAGCGA